MGRTSLQLKLGAGRCQIRLTGGLWSIGLAQERKAIEQDTGTEVAKRQCEELSQSLSVDFEPYYASQAAVSTQMAVY